MNITVRVVAPALLLATLVLLPFFGKPFTIDDTVFLFEARHALADPLHPTAFEMTWRYSPERVSQLVPTGPIMAWLLVPSILAGGSEWIAHAIQLVMFCLAILATVSLGRRLGFATPWAAASGLILVGMPAVLAMAGTAMPDVPAMALGVMGVERLVAWTQDRRLLQAVSAALLLGLAPLARPHLLLILGVGAILIAGPVLLQQGWRNRLSVCLPLLGAPVITAVMAFFTRDPDSGAGSLIGTAVYYSSLSGVRLAANFAAFLIHCVLVMAFALPWIAFRWRFMLRSHFTLTAAATGILGSALALIIARQRPLVLAVVAGLGVAVLFDGIKDGLRRRDWMQVALFCWVLIPLSAVPYVHLPPKYLIVSAPAMALLVTRQLASRGGKTGWLILAATVVVGMGLGVAILRADAVFADVGRRAASELIAPRIAAGQRVWFVGRWGFQWYAEKAGARPVTLTPPYPEPGDVIVASAASARSDEILDMIARRFARLIPVAHLEDTTPGGRIMNKRLGVGFYSNVSGYWPWMWGDSMIDAFSVWQIE